ncbi:hypothetical protein [Lichenicola sp.]|uniref:hypothetical protein n=1 Tax=Lichenicola sp. TaxID=2804529 RepID=UPI003B00C705
MTETIHAPRPRLMLLAATTMLASGLGVQHAFAWGHTGHVEISYLAASALPSDVPAFLRTPDTAQAIGQLGPEPDISKTSGTTHDSERDAGHYVDLNDDGTVPGGSLLKADGTPVTLTREGFDTMLRAGGSDQYQEGYLPYNIVDGWQQVRKDLAYIRADQIGLATATNDTDRQYFAYQLGLRQQLTIRDIGVWSHYVGDGSQPLHVSIHYNGWGNYPNPNGYTTKPIHAQFEGAFVKNFVPLSTISALVPAYHNCGCAIETRVSRYMMQTLSQVQPLYQVAKIDLFTTPNPTEVQFAAQQLANGAAELRDEIYDAWKSSETISVGYPLIAVTDIESGKVHLTSTSFAAD